MGARPRRICVRGHDTEILGRRDNGNCIACHKTYFQEYRRKELFIKDTRPLPQGGLLFDLPTAATVRLRNVLMERLEAYDPSRKREKGVMR